MNESIFPKRRLKFVSNLNMGQSPSSEDVSVYEFGIPFIQGCAEFGVINPLPKYFCVNSRKLANSGDILISVRAPVGSMNIADKAIGIGRGICAIQNLPSRVSSRFLFYAVITSLDELKSLSTGSTYDAVSTDDLGSITVYSPPIKIQKAIASYLDKETARIDTLIEKKERQIELLQEKRQAIITRAVTKGLNPNAKMKNSGVEWIGEIPQHWKARKTKQLAKLVSGHTPSRQHPEWWFDCSIPWFGLVDVWQIRSGRRMYIAETDQKISELGLANSSAQLHPAGTVVLSRTASVGYSAIMAIPMATTQDFADWICGKELFNEYLYYVFQSMRTEFDRLMMGSTHQTIYMPDIEQFVIPHPPINEQLEIVSYLSKRLIHVDRELDLIEKSKALLREYRSSLITSAVSGQIDLELMR